MNDVLVAIGYFQVARTQTFHVFDFKSYDLIRDTASVLGSSGFRVVQSELRLIHRCVHVRPGTCMDRRGEKARTWLANPLLTLA